MRASGMLRRAGRFALAFAVIWSAALADSGGGRAGGRAGLPLAVSSATLQQRGRELVWRVTLAQPFSPGALARDRRTLCLLIERPADGTVAGAACLTRPARHSRAPRLTYARVTARGSGRPRLVPATVTRSSSRELTASFLPAAVGLGYRPVRWQVISTLSGQACTAPHPGAARCFVLFPRSPRLLELHVPKLVGCVARGPLWVSHGLSRVREIALTFDDGPWYDTGQFLRLLEREHVVATFFQIGDQIGLYGEGGALDRRMLANGDMIGDHTWDHHDVSAGGAYAAEEIRRAAAAIRDATGGFRPCLFRAPYGDVSTALLELARSLGFTTIQWDVDPRDWARPGVAAIYENVIAHAHDGAIVIQHDGGGDRSQTLAALPYEIGALRRAGYRFVTVTQLLGYQLLYR
jgi:peptidoglycan/xylan/chitin deacetylase (PgdA/CDA1 family)